MAGKSNKPQRRLEQLYEIGKLLTLFEGAAKTIPQIMAIIGETLPLRSAIAILAQDPPIMIVSGAPGASETQLRIAKDRALASSAYFSGTSDGSTALDASQKSFISLPLVVAGRGSFGALQLEGAGRLDEHDLAFANAIANQLAVAIDRQQTLEAGRIAAEDHRTAGPERVSPEKGDIDAEHVRDGAEARGGRYKALVDSVDKFFVWEAEADLGSASQQSWFKRIHPDDRDLVRRTLDAVAGGVLDQGCLHRCLAPNGEIRWFKTEAHLLGGGTASPRLLGVSVDVTALKDAEEEARRQLDFIGPVSDRMGEGIVAVDLERRITFMSTTAEALLGCSAKAVLGTPIDEILEMRHPDGRKIASDEDPLGHAIFTREPYRNDEISMRRVDGTTFPANLSAAPLSRAGHVSGAVMVFQNLVEVKRAERQQRFLTEASALFASPLEYKETLTAVANLAVPLLADVCIFDELVEAGTTERIAAAFVDDEKRGLVSQAMPVGVAPEQKTPQAASMESGSYTFIGTVPSPRGESPEDREHAEVMRAAGLASMIVVPLRARARTLGALTLAVAESELRYSASDLILAQDIAYRAAIAIDNAHLAAAAQKAIRARQDLLAIVSHDLKTPLSVILLNLDGMQAGTEADERTRKSVDRISRSAKHMRRMIGDLLDSAIIEGLGLPIERSPVDVARLVSEAFDALEPLTANKVGLVKEIAPDLPTIFADETRIHQVLSNLVGNAVKFTAAGGTITVRAEAVDLAVRFSVSDTGSGIAEADVGHLFERFYQARATARQGAGLGLFIVRGIVEAHGGRIWVETQLGVGSTFYFTVPIAGPTESTSPL